nr:hypothetical protein [uncultured Roseateles sp.]
MTEHDCGPPGTPLPAAMAPIVLKQILSECGLVYPELGKLAQPTRVQRIRGAISEVYPGVGIAVICCADGRIYVCRPETPGNDFKALAQDVQVELLVAEPENYVISMSVMVNLPANEP